MRPFTSVVIHLDDDTACHAEKGERTFWLRLGDSVVIFVESENALGELLGAIDQASKLMCEES